MKKRAIRAVLITATYCSLFLYGGYSITKKNIIMYEQKRFCSFWTVRKFIYSAKASSVIFLISMDEGVSSLTISGKIFSKK
ncbi:hypothetical protein ABH892_002212 [Paenibacillus sp. RC254]